MEPNWQTIYLALIAYLRDMQKLQNDNHPRLWYLEPVLADLRAQVAYATDRLSEQVYLEEMAEEAFEVKAAEIREAMRRDPDCVNQGDGR